jgi:Fic family protein
LDASLSGVVSDAEGRIHALNRTAMPALAPLARLLLRTESIASSKIEGMQVNARSLARAELREDAGARLGTETLEVLASVDAMQLAVEEASASSELRVDDLLAIHRLLLERTKPEIAGVVRDEQNWIGGNDYNPCGADFVPPPPAEVDALLEDLIAFCNRDDLPPLVQAAVAHAQFETIHPFRDGNGRTGRALLQVILRRRGLAPSYVPPVSVVLAAGREAYISGLTDFRSARESEWLENFSVAAARASDLAASYLNKVSQLQDRWRDSLKESIAPRSDAASWAIIDVLPAFPVISGSVGAVAISRSRPATDQGIKQLVEAAVLLPLSDTRRNRIWEAAGLLDLLEELEAARPAPAQ